MYPAAELVLAKYVVRLIGGEYSEDDHMVLHDKRISKSNQDKITAYAEALNATEFGHP